MIKRSPKSIKKRLIDLELKQTEIAKELGISSQAVGAVVNGDRSSQRVESYINALFIKTKAA